MPQAPRPGWSLTRRLALRFAVTTSVIIALASLGSVYALYDALRDELRDFLEHEMSELIARLDDSGSDPAALQATLDSFAAVATERPTAYQVRRSDGTPLAESGRPRLLRAATGELPVMRPSRITHTMLRSPVFAVERRAADGLRAWILVDTSDIRGKLMAYLGWAGVAFLGAALLAGLSGAFTAWSGLASLRQFSGQAHRIDIAATDMRVELTDPPREIAELGRELNAMLERIAQGLAQMRTFTASLAHELRSPLQTLIGETEVALLAKRSPEEHERLLRSHLDDLNELSDVVDNLVAWCRSAEPRPRSAPRESFELAEEARLRLDRERRTAQRAGVTLDLEMSGDTRLVADREACLRLVRNLAGNAIAWTPPGGRVTLRVDGEPDNVRVTVEDQGPGIPAELNERVYEPFVSGPARPGRRGGYGLGLAICRAVVAEHGGRLWHESRPGGGTRFLAELPRAPARRAV